MVKNVDEGLPLLGQYRKSNVIFQVGSQPISGLAYAKAKELYKGGAIGNLNCIALCQFHRLICFRYLHRIVEGLNLRCLIFLSLYFLV